MSGRWVLLIDNASAMRIDLARGLLDAAAVPYLADSTEDLEGGQPLLQRQFSLCVPASHLELARRVLESAWGPLDLGTLAPRGP